MSDRDPMQRDSRRRGARLMMASTMRYHSVVEGGRWVLCGCCPSIRPLGRWSELRRGGRKYFRWAAR